ncbi:MAG: aldo/keto reductase [Opitutales bacterium]|nr:aldo/keto reductase [Opitutales bacterium]
MPVPPQPLSDLPSFSPYTFGAMSLGSDFFQLEKDIKLARQAMEAGVWFHASPTYHRGFCFMALRLAFDQARHQTPPLIIKIRDHSPTVLRFEIEDTCRRLGLDSIDIIQLVAMDQGDDNLARDLAHEGPLAAELHRLREEGLYRQATLFLTKPQEGYLNKIWPTGLISSVILYWNAVQRACADSDWAYIEENQIPVLALRTLGGGFTNLPENLRAEAETLLAESGCTDWAELNLRLAASVPLLQTTIGGTGNPAHLNRFLELQAAPSPLDPTLTNRIITWRENLST